MLAVDPEPDKRLPGGRFALRDFVFVMRKNVIHTAAMDVESFAEIFHRHGRTFQVPARTPFAKRRLPLGFARILRSLPEDEIARLLLFVFVCVNAGADLQFSSVQLGKTPIVW